MSAHRFRWGPLGGLGEVGMNTMVFRFGDISVPVDAGIGFADPNDFGIEALYPDYLPLIKAERPKHWLITHAHEDHIGAVPAVLQAYAEAKVPPPRILAPPLAAELIRGKIADDSRYPKARDLIECVEDVAGDSTVQLGNELKVHFLSTRHSTLDTCSLAFEWEPEGSAPLRIVHTADFKLDPTSFEDGVKDLVSVYGVFHRRGLQPDLLFIDSTNADRPGHSVSEAEILPGLARLMETAPGRVFLTLFSSNVQRIASLVALAAKQGRYVCLAGRSLQSAHQTAMRLGLYGTSCAEILLSHLKDASELASLPARKQLVICSGSQGEHRSVLAKVSQGTHAEFDLGPGDRVVFSSKLIPGNERPVGRLINGLLRRGAEVLGGDHAKDVAGGPIHASGHARRDEIAAVMKFLKPRHVVPVHGELRHLRACAAIARNYGPEWGLDSERVHVVENGTELTFEEVSRQWELGGKKIADGPLPKRLRFEDFSAPSLDEFLRVRKRLASAGVVSVCVNTLGRIDVKIDGMLPEELRNGAYGDGLMDDIHGWMFAKFKAAGAKALRDRDGRVATELADGLSRHIRRSTGLRPHVIVHLVPES